MGRQFGLRDPSNADHRAHPLPYYASLHREQNAPGLNQPAALEAQMDVTPSKSTLVIVVWKPKRTCYNKPEANAEAHKHQRAVPDAGLGEAVCAVYVV